MGLFRLELSADKPPTSLEDTRFRPTEGISLNDVEQNHGLAEDWLDPLMLYGVGMGSSSYEKDCV